MRTHSVLMMIGFLGLAGGLSAQSAERRVGGAEIRLTSFVEQLEVRGELLAAINDTIWIDRRGVGAASPFAFADVRLARVRAHDAGARWSLKWVALGWGISSLGLTIACAEVSQGCTSVPLIMAVPWGLIGGIAAGTNESGTWLDLRPDGLSELQRYARFPQGLPVELRR